MSEHLPEVVETLNIGKPATSKIWFYVYTSLLRSITTVFLHCAACCALFDVLRIAYRVRCNRAFQLVVGSEA